MADRNELLEATLDSLPEGIALLGDEGLLAFWNPAAEAISGYTAAELLGRPLPETLEPLLHFNEGSGKNVVVDVARPGHGSLVSLQHKLGHSAPMMARILVLRDGLGGRIGTAIVFHPAESMDALPHGDAGDDQNVQSSQADLEDRLSLVFEDFTSGSQPFGLLWMRIDQAHDLRKTHGVGACEAMLEKVVRTMAHGLRPGEEMGRWGEDEFLVISHERTNAMLAAHAQALAGMARTADFRWWGDRISLTVSIGAAQSEPAETLAQLLGRAQEAMTSSIHAGGNQITSAPGRA